MILHDDSAQWSSCKVIYVRIFKQNNASYSQKILSMKGIFFLLGIYRILVIKENLLQNTTDVSWIMWKLQWNWDSHSHWSWQQIFNFQPKYIQHITHTVCYHILNFFENTMKMRLELLLKWKRNMFQFFLWYFLEFRKVLLRYLQKDWLLFTTF